MLFCIQRAKQALTLPKQDCLLTTLGKKLFKHFTEMATSFCLFPECFLPNKEKLDHLSHIKNAFNLDKDKIFPTGTRSN